MILNNGIFYEFVPFNEENFNDNDELLPGATALTIDKVKEGTDYARSEEHTSELQSH